MSGPVLDVEIRAGLPGFALGARFRSEEGTIGIFGASGAGKSTLLRALAGLIRADGHIRFDGTIWLESDRGLRVAPELRRIGYVPQDGLLFPHWTVRENVMAGGARRGGRAGSSGRRGREVDPAEAIRVLDLGALLGRGVTGLSGGERQRVALARALCSGPELLLMDEPLGSIDRPLRARILPYLLDVRESFRIPTLFVSHDALEIEMLCDHVFVLDRGRITAGGTPHEVFTAASPGAALPGDLYENLLEGIVEHADGEMASIRLGGGPLLAVTVPAGLTRGARVTLGIRAAEIMIALDAAHGLSARNVLPGRVIAIASVEGGDLVRVALGGPSVEVEVAVMVTDAARKALDLREGRQILLVAKARSFHILAAR